MNGKQRVVVLVGTAVLLGMLLYPPWGVPTVEVFIGQTYLPPSYIDHGYAPVFAPPHPVTSINTFRLFFQCATVVLLTFGLYVALGHKKN